MRLDEETANRELERADAYARAGQLHSAVARIRALERSLRRRTTETREAWVLETLARVRQAQSSYRHASDAWEAGVRYRQVEYRARERAAAASAG